MSGYHHAKHIINFDWLKFFFSVQIQKKHFNAKLHCLLNCYKSRTLPSTQTIQIRWNVTLLISLYTCNSVFVHHQIKSVSLSELHASSDELFKSHLENVSELNRQLFFSSDKLLFNTNGLRLNVIAFREELLKSKINSSSRTILRAISR